MSAPDQGGGTMKRQAKPEERKGVGRVALREEERSRIAEVLVVRLD